MQSIETVLGPVAVPPAAEFYALTGSVTVPAGSTAELRLRPRQGERFAFDRILTADDVALTLQVNGDRVLFDGPLSQAVQYLYQSYGLLFPVVAEAGTEIVATFANAGVAAVEAELTLVGYDETALRALEAAWERSGFDVPRVRWAHATAVVAAGASATLTITLPEVDTYLVAGSVPHSKVYVHLADSTGRLWDYVDLTQLLVWRLSEGLLAPVRLAAHDRLHATVENRDTSPRTVTVLLELYEA